MRICTTFFITPLFLFVSLLLPFAVTAEIVTVDPDAYTDNTDISNAVEGVTLSSIDRDSAGPVFSRTDGHSSTGTQTFGNNGTGGIVPELLWFEGEGYDGTNSILRVDFDLLIDFVSIDIINQDSFDQGILRAFDSNNTEIDSDIATVSGTPATLSISVDHANIAYITVAGSSVQDSVHLDNLQFNKISIFVDGFEESIMTFFVTSTGNGAMGGNLGGLSGADAKCQNLATNGGAGSRTWHAYLSTDSPLVNARDRIGSGPWFNQAGTMVAANLTELHNNITGSLLLDEEGQPVPSSPLDHDILTGSTTDGNVMSGKTCNNWTDGTDASGGQVGHADIAVEDLGDESWNSQHDPQCSESALASTAGTGRIYCFAIN